MGSSVSADWKILLLTFFLAMIIIFALAYFIYLSVSDDSVSGNYSNESVGNINEEELNKVLEDFENRTILLPIKAPVVEKKKEEAIDQEE